MKKYLSIISVLSLVFLFSCEKVSQPLANTGSNGKSVGESANDLLSDRNFNKLIVEIDYMPGMRPTAGAMTALENMINTLTNKPNGVVFNYSEVPSGGQSSYSISQIEALEKSHRNSFNDGKTIAVYFLFVDGAYSTGNVLGVAYRNTSLCIFEKTVKDNSGRILMPSTEKLETTVVNHEYGHILGLVDVGTSMKTNHKDAANGAHCTNSSCLMYYQVETTDFVGNLTNSPVPTLDTNCKNDLKGNGGK